MSQTKLKNLIYIQQKRFRSIILMLGVSVSVFAISSNYHKISDSEKALKKMEVQINESVTSLESPEIVSTSTHPETKPKLKIHHNFIVSYLFQESSFERKNNYSKGHTEFVSNLKQMHRVIIKHTLGII